MFELHPSDCRPLIVDDDHDFNLLLKRCLQKVGIPRLGIRSCHDGDEAVEILSSQASSPSFILLDHHMPGRSGLEVLEWVRSVPTLSEVPVFMLTSSSDPGHVARAFELGVSSYFIKPMETRALEGILEGIVGYWKSRQRPAVVRGSLKPV